MSTATFSEDRCRRVRLLLQTRFDYLPGSVNGDALMTSTGLIGLGAQPGPAGSASRVPVACGACKRRGFIIAKDGVRLRCPVCNGETRARTTDDPKYDLYLGLPELEARTQRPTEPERRPLRLKLDEGDEPAAYGWERRKQAQESYGSYRELAHALARLKELMPGTFDLLHRIYFRDVAMRLSDGAIATERRGVIFLSERMPGQIRVPPWLLEDERARTGRRVRDLRAQGMTQGEIARSIGLTKDAVRALLRSSQSSKAVVS